MSIVIENPNWMILLITIFVCIVFFQIYLLLKIRIIAQKILEMFVRFDIMVNELNKGKRRKKSKAIKTCQSCKNRIVYLHSEDESYFYIRCRLNNQTVSPDNVCNYFVLDPQNYEI